MPRRGSTRTRFANFGSGRTKAWRDIWSAGQGVGTIDDLPATAELIAAEGGIYRCARGASVGEQMLLSSGVMTPTASSRMAVRPVPDPLADRLALRRG